MPKKDYRVRSFGNGKSTEAWLRCYALNKMTLLGMPISEPV